jgi:hypothetical protein
MMNNAKLSFYDIFDQRRITSLRWTTLKPGETGEQKHVWLYNRRDGSPGSLATRLRVTALGLTPAGDAICFGKYIEARSDGVSPGLIENDSQSEFKPIGDSLLESGKYLDIGDIPPGCGRRLIFRLNLPEEFDDYGPAMILLATGYREPEE